MAYTNAEGSSRKKKPAYKKQPVAKAKVAKTTNKAKKRA